MSPASTSPAISTMADNDTVFRSTVSDAAQGVVLANFALQQGIKSAGAIYINNPYGEGLANMFSQAFIAGGGTITATVPSEPGQTSYLSEVKKATAGNLTPPNTQAPTTKAKEIEGQRHEKKRHYTDSTIYIFTCCYVKRCSNWAYY